MGNLPASLCSLELQVPNPLEWTDLRVTGRGRTCAHSRALPLGLLMPEVYVKTALFYAWKEGR